MSVVTFQETGSGKGPDKFPGVNVTFRIYSKLFKLKILFVISEWWELWLMSYFSVVWKFLEKKNQ